MVMPASQAVACRQALLGSAGGCQDTCCMPLVRWAIGLVLALLPFALALPQATSGSSATRCRWDVVCALWCMHWTVLLPLCFATEGRDAHGCSAPHLCCRRFICMPPAMSRWACWCLPLLRTGRKRARRGNSSSRVSRSSSSSQARLLAAKAARQRRSGSSRRQWPLLCRCRPTVCCTTCWSRSCLRCVLQGCVEPCM